MNPNFQNSQTIQSQIIQNFKEIFNFTSKDSEFDFEFEINQIKYFNKCLYEIKIQFDLLRDFIEIENKDAEYISNTKNSYFDKFFTQTTNFSKEPSEIFNHIKNFTNFLFQYLNLNKNEIMKNEIIYNYISEFNIDYNTHLKNYLNKVSILMKILLEIIEAYKKKKKSRTKLRDELREEIKNLLSLNPYDVSELERTENKISSLKEKSKKLNDEINHRKEFLENKKSELNLAIRNLIENYVKIIFKSSFNIKQILLSIFQCKLKFLERMRKSKEIFYLGLNETQCIFLTELAERKFSVDENGIFYESLENIKNSFEQISSNLNFISSPGQLRYILINLNHLINYMNNFPFLFSVRKKILNYFSGLTQDLMKNFVNVKIENSTKILKLINTFSENFKHFDEYFSNSIQRDDQQQKDLKEIFNFSTWGGVEYSPQKNLNTSEYLNVYGSFSLYELSEYLLKNFEELKLFLSLDFLEEMKKTNEIYKNDIKEFSLIKTKFTKDISTIKSDLSKFLSKFKNNACANVNSQTKSISIQNEYDEQIFTLTENEIQDLKLKNVSNSINELSDLLKIMRENENMRVKKFIIEMKIIFDKFSNIIEKETKSYENLVNINNGIDLNRFLKFLLEPSIYNFQIDPLFITYMNYELRKYFEQERKNLNKNFSYDILLKLGPENVQDPQQSYQSFQSDQYKLAPATDFNFLFLKKFEDITKENLEESYGEVENTEQGDASKSQDVETTERKSTNSQQNRLFRTVSDGTNLEDQSFENFNCALKDIILIQGKLYLTEDNLIFSSWFNVKTIFGGTKVIIPIDDILSIRKSKYLKIFNNAITLNTSKFKKITFVSFINRDKCYDLIEDLINKKKNLIEEKIIEEKEEQEYFYDEKNEGDIVERVRSNDIVRESIKENFDLPTDLNDIYYKRAMMKKIILETDVINRLEMVTRVKLQELYQCSTISNIKTEFYNHKIYEREAHSRLPADIIYNIMFGRDYKMSHTQNKNFLETILEERKDRNISIAIKKEITPSKDNDESFTNILYNLNEKSIEDFLLRVESAKASDTLDFTVEYIHPMKSIFLPSEIKITENYKTFFVSPLLIIVTRSTYTDGTPYDDCFHTEMQYRIETAITYKDQINYKSFISNYFTVVFDKYVLMKKIIEKEGVRLANENEKKTLSKLKEIFKDEEKIFFKEIKENFELRNYEEEEEYKTFVETMRSREKIVFNEIPTVDKEREYPRIKKFESDEEIVPEMKNYQKELGIIDVKEEKINDEREEIRIERSWSFINSNYYIYLILILIIVLLLRLVYKILFSFDVDIVLNNIAIIAILIFVYKKSEN